VTAQKVDPKAKPYRSADIPLIAVEDIVSTKQKGKVLLEKGQAVGISLSTTNWKNWASFWKGLQSANIDTKTTKVLVKLGYEDKTNAAGNEWAVFTFEFLSVVDDVEDYLAEAA
jgi:hypothetical protein